MSVKIYTDAASNLFKSLLLEKGIDNIEVFPMELRFEDKRYYCYEDDIDVKELSKQFYHDMRKGMKPKTTLVSPGVMLDTFEKDVKEGNQVIYVTMASGISGTYQAACLTAKDINDQEGKEVVHIIDAKTAGFGEGLIAMKVAKMANDGASFEEIIKEGELYVNRVRSEFTVDDLKYLSATGRISKLVAKIANVLSIKPLLYGSDKAKIEVTSKVHGRTMAIKALANQVIKHINDPENQLVFISHCDSEEDANKLKDILVNKGIKNIEVHYYDLITGAHVGPGTLAIFYEGTDRNI